MQRFLVVKLCAVLVAACVSVVAQNTPTDRIQRGAGGVFVQAAGSILLRPGASGSIIIPASCIGAALSVNNEARLCFDAAVNALRLSVNGSAYAIITTAGGAGAGTVTSVGLALPSIFALTNSPITGAGTLAASFITQPANALLAGPASGASAEPSFRLLNAADVPSLDVSKLSTGILSNARGGTGLASYVFGDLLYANGANALARLSGSTLSTQRFLSQTGDGTLSAIPGWSAINLNGGAAAGLAGILPVGNGGSGMSTTGSANQLLGTNAAASGLQYKTLAAGSNLTITNTGSTITIDASGTLGAKWSNLTSPEAALSLAMSAYPTTFTWSNGNLITFTGTGLLGANTSAPTFGVHVRGNGIYSQPLTSPTGITVTANTAGTSTYYYWIIAKDLAGRRTIHAAQTIFSANATPNNTVTWNAVAGAASYDVLRDTNSSGGTSIALSVTATTLVDNNLPTSAYTYPRRNSTSDSTFGGGITVGDTITQAPLTFSSLGGLGLTAANGTWVFCSNCTHLSTPCSSGGTGALAKLLNGVWQCN